MKKIILLLLCIFPLVTLGLEPLPSMNNAVIDNLGLLSNEDRNNIENRLRLIHDSGKMQMAVMIIDKLPADESVEQYSMKVVENWKLGSASADNGLLFLISMGSRKVRIEVGQGLEGSITDLYSKRIINEITPLLKSKEYYKAIVTVIDKIESKIDADNAPPPTTEEIQAEKERIALQAAREKQEAKELREILIHSFGCALFVFGFVLIYNSRKIPGKMKKTKEEIDLIFKNNENSKKNVLSLEKEVSEMKVDPDKLRMYRLIEEISTARSNVGSIKSNIEKYKRYLGEL